MVLDAVERIIVYSTRTLHLTGMPEPAISPWSGNNSRTPAVRVEETNTRKCARTSRKTERGQEARRSGSSL